jgi:hypothetical protein
MRYGHDLRSRQMHFMLDTLQALPCGCIAAIYHAQPLDTEVVSLEARGPHCLYLQHQVGHLLGVTTADADRLSR